MAAFAAQQVAAMEEKPVEEEPAEEAAPAAQSEEESDPFGEPLDVTRRIDLDELKFGRNYGRD